MQHYDKNNHTTDEIIQTEKLTKGFKEDLDK